MATKIDFKTYERNCKNKNKRGLLRGYTSLYNHPEELGIMRNAGVIDRILLEVSVDISQVDSLIKLLKDKGFRVYGDDYYYLECAYNDYTSIGRFQNSIKPEDLKSMQLELIDRKTNEVPYKIDDNDNATFYLLPFNDECESIYDFIRKNKKDIIEFSKRDDVTIMMNPKGYSDQIQGFIGFNFYDLDEKEDGKEVEVDFACGFNVAVDFNKPVTIYSSALYLNALAKDKSELKDINVCLYAENYR